MSIPAVPSALTLVSRPRQWASNRKHPGLANGWHGPAWLAYKLTTAGAAVPAGVFDDIGRRLADALRCAPSTGRFGGFIGCGADAVIAAYAARQGSASPALARRACRRVMAASAASGLWDLHMGLAGALIAFAEIATVERAALRDLAPDRLARALMAKLDALCALPAHGWQTGMAHGPAGAIMALETAAAMGWCRITNPRRQRWLDLLARCALAAADGALLWPAIAGDRELGLQSWCAGTPGVALALLQCFRLTDEPVYLELARDALAGTRQLADRAFFSDTLCCGSAGYRHIFIEAYRITGEDPWLALAAREPRRARAAAVRPRRSLLQGRLGVAYLADRLARPRDYPLPGLGTSSA